MVEFLHDNIFTHYEPPKELLSNNSTNLLAQVVKHYIRKLSIKHRNTTSYHPRTNGKVENLNKTLEAILTKYLTNKFTMLWNLYLSQALFAIRIRLHATSKKSSFYLLYEVHSRIFFDINELRPLNIKATQAQYKERIARLYTAKI